MLDDVTAFTRATIFDTMNLDVNDFCYFAIYLIEKAEQQARETKAAIARAKRQQK